MAGVALATGLIPILIHLINRRRYVRVRWAAMSFLMAAHQRSAKRLWLEHWLLLATRMAVIVLFGMAVARPYLPASSLLPLRTSRVHRIILLDNSLSMNARTESGETRFSWAKRYALQRLDAFPSADAISLVTLAEPAEVVIEQPAYDRRFVRERLTGVEQTQRGTDTVGALTAAMQATMAACCASMMACTARRLAAATGPLSSPARSACSARTNPAASEKAIEACGRGLADRKRSR